MTTNADRSRRKNFVDSHVQGALCKRILLHWFAFFITAMFAIAGIQILLGNPELSIGQRMSQQTGYFVFLAIVLFSLLPAFMLDTIRFSNRFVGPIARLRRCMRELATYDNTEEVHFREFDFWNDAAKEFNAMRRKYLEYKRLCDENDLKPRFVDDPVKTGATVSN